MKTNYSDIRKNLHVEYNEEYLKNILLNFYNQILDNTNFRIENRNINKILDFFFQDLIYIAKSKNGKYSPNEIVNNDQLLELALNYIDNHRDFYHNKSDITNLKDFFFNSSMVGKVTNFNPVIARKIFEYYAPENATIFDYSCGFGSRLLGALSSKKHYQYIGVDPYTELIERLLIFADWIQDIIKDSNKPIIINQGSEEFIPSLCNKVDLSFSSPPYFNYEIYTDCNTQSYIKYPIYEEWKNNYITKTIFNIYRYTKSNGIHAVNLQDTKRISIIDDWIEISSEIGFKLEEIRTIETVKRKTTKNENKLLVMRKK